jgi:hypothetical protein
MDCELAVIKATFGFFDVCPWSLNKKFNYSPGGDEWRHSSRRGSNRLRELL